jgi:hypothetical protein
MRKYSCKIDPTHGSFWNLDEAVRHVVAEGKEKKMDMEKPLSDFLEVTDTWSISKSRLSRIQSGRPANPLSKEEMIPVMFASVMAYCEAMNWTYEQAMNFITETFGMINKLKVAGKLEKTMLEKSRRSIYSHWFRSIVVAVKKRLEKFIREPRIRSRKNLNR